MTIPQFVPSHTLSLKVLMSSHSIVLGRWGQSIVCLTDLKVVETFDFSVGREGPTLLQFSLYHLLVIRVVSLYSSDWWSLLFILNEGVESRSNHSDPRDYLSELKVRT